MRTFNYTDRFDAIIAVEAVHGVLDLELLRRLESLVKKGGIIVLTLPSLPESMNVEVLVEMGYAVFRYFLRGFILVRIDKPEVYTISNRLWRILCAFTSNTSKSEVMDIGMKLKERASKLFDIEYEITNPLCRY